jgi:hypothetical protein
MAVPDINIIHHTCHFSSYFLHTIRLIKKNYKYNFFCLLYVYCCMYFKLDLSFLHVCDNFLNKTNDQSCQKKSTVTNISI